MHADARLIKDQPYIIVGDLNGEPKDFENTRAMRGCGQLHDVGTIRTKAGR